MIDRERLDEKLRQIFASFMREVPGAIWDRVLESWVVYLGDSVEQEELDAALDAQWRDMESADDLAKLSPRRIYDRINGTGSHSLKVIAEAVCNESGVKLEHLRSARRARDYAWPRQVFMLLAKDMTGKSLPQIGRFLERDHTTIIHGIRAAEKRMTTDEDTRNLVAAVQRRVMPVRRPEHLH